MKVVHICSYFNTSSLYKNLFESLANLDIDQEVFIPLYRKQSISPKNYGTVSQKEMSSTKIKYHYIECLKKFDRYLLVYRTLKLYYQMIENIDINKNVILHGHSLFANGGICYLASIKKSTEYIVAFRNTDLFIYSKLVIYRYFAKLIISRAKNIVFISYSLKYRFLAAIKDDELRKMVIDKGVVIPNGLPDTWFDEEIYKSDRNFDNIRFIYQGTFHKRKNVDYIIKLVEKLNDKGIRASLDIVGGGPEKSNLLMQIKKSKYSNDISLRDWTNDFSQILQNYQKNSIFIMPSENETFGISYLEALAVGLPIVYKEGDGIDGFFNDIKVGTAVSGSDIELDIIRVIEVIDNYNDIVQNTQNVINDFAWRNISKEYEKRYL